MSDKDAFLQELERYRPYLSAERFAQHLEDSAFEAASAVRINRLKIGDPKRRLAELASKYGWSTQSLPFSEDAMQVTSYAIAPSQTIEHKLGQFYIQDAASILPVSLFTPSAKPLLTLDMAASPGGKTTQLIDAGMDHDFVIANDSAISRIPALRVVLQTWGAINYAVTNFPGEKWGDWYPDTFDRILLDAPCSMQSLRASASHPHRPITTDERGRLAARQTALLFSAAKALKPGGELVYSTCTLSPEEDEAVVSALLESFPDSFEIDPVDAQRYHAHGLTSFEGQTFDPQTVNSLRIWPDIFQTNGFFAVKLSKVNQILDDQSERLVSPSKRFDVNELSPNTLAILFDYFLNSFGFDLGALLAERNLGLYWRADKIWLLPKILFSHFHNFPIQMSGLAIGQFIRQDFEPSQDFFHAFGNQFTQGHWILPDHQIESWMKGYDIRGIDIPGQRTGSFLSIRDQEGNNLGAGKYSKERLRNLLPNRHLIR